MKPIIRLLRPATLFAPVLAGLFGYMAFCSRVDLISAITGLVVGLSFSTAQAFGQVVNQIVDVELDKIVKPDRPLPSGKITTEQAISVATALLMSSLLLSMLVSQMFVICITMLLFFAAWYSLPPLSPRKVNPILNNLWVSISRGLIPILAVQVAAGSPIDVTMSIGVFLWVMALQPTKDVTDVEGDRMMGIKTVLTELGVDGFRTIAVPTVVVSSILMYERPYLLFVLPIGIAAAITCKRKFLKENNMGWYLYYFGLGMIYLALFASRVVT